MMATVEQQQQQQQQIAPEFEVRSSFVSIIDHYPCELTRKLWLIQSFNQKESQLRNALDLKLKELQNFKIKIPENPTNPIIALSDPDTGLDPRYKTLLDQIREIRVQINQVRKESLTESHSILKLTQTAKTQVTTQNEQLKHELQMYKNDLKLRQSRDMHGKRSNRRVNVRDDGKEMKKVTLKIKLHPQKVSISTLKKLKVAQKEVNSNKDEGKKDQDTDVYDSNDDNILWCICRKNSSSGGKMVACDNLDCETEWYHMKCLGMKKVPVGKWYCPDCVKAGFPETP